MFSLRFPQLDPAGLSYGCLGWTAAAIPLRQDDGTGPQIFQIVHIHGRRSLRVVNVEIATARQCLLARRPYGGQVTTAHANATGVTIGTERLDQATTTAVIGRRG